MKRARMSTIGGMSVRAEIEARLEDARAGAFEEAIMFLGSRGHLAAAEDLQRAAFGEQAGKAAP